MMKLLGSTGVAVATLLLTGCASLGGLQLQAPRLAAADSPPAELRLLGPGPQRPLGGASLRLYARIENPNPIGITLAALSGTLLLEGFEAVQSEFPLGLPLRAGESTVVPLDVTLSFSNLPGLAEIVSRGVTAGRLNYSLQGIATLDAGVLGQPSFGPMTLLDGSVQARR